MAHSLALLSAVLALVAPVAAIMKPPLSSSEEEAQPVLAGGKLASPKACAPAYDFLSPVAAPVALSVVNEALIPAGDEPKVRACRETVDVVKSLEALVLPEFKLAFCYIPKVACTQFKDLFNHVNGLNTSVGFGKDGDYLASAWTNLGIKKKDITRENGWRFATFTRDPALRYLSTFGDVCPLGNPQDLDLPSMSGHQWSCCGPMFDAGRAEEGPWQDDQYRITAFKTRVKLDVKAGRVHSDQHWASQTQVLEQCGWELFKPDNLDYWGVLSGDVNMQVKDMLKTVGHRDDVAVDRFFPKEGVAGHTGYLKGEPPDFINDVETLGGIVQLYADDYRNLPGVGCAFTEPLLAKLRAANTTGH